METVKSLGQKESERQGKKVLGIALLLLFLNYGILILTNNYGSIVEQQSGFQYVVSLTMVINNIIDAIRDGWLPLGTMGAILLTVFAIFEVKEEKYYLEYFRITEKGILKLDTSISLECLKYLPIGYCLWSMTTHPSFHIRL